MKKLLLLAALAFSACPAPMMTPDGGHAHEGETTRGRLLVADGTAAKLTIIDLDDGSTPGTLTLQGVASVYSDPTDTLGMGYLVQRANNVTQLVTSGVAFAEHDGHYHLSKAAPSLMTSSIAGQGPTHFVLHDGWATIFNDTDGTADYLQRSQLAIGMVAPQRHATGAAHHGVALVANGQLVSTIPDPVDPMPGATRMPVGVSSRLASDPSMLGGEFTNCPGLHGEASNDTTIVFGCTDGVLVLTWDGSKYVSTKIANPANTPATTRVGTLLGAHEMTTFVGNFGSDALAVIDPAAGTLTPFTLPAVSLGFKLFHEEHVIVLTLDGKLRKFDPATGAAQGDGIDVIPAYAMAPTGHGGVRPGLAISGDSAYVTDPRNGKVVEVAIEHWEVERTFDVGGAPASVAVVSVSPDLEPHEH